VTHRGVAHEFTVVSGHLPPGHRDSLVDWSVLARLRGTLVLLMAVENLGAIAAALLEGGRSAGTPAAVVQDGSMASQQALFSTLDRLATDVARKGIRPPAVVVIGGVVDVAEGL
jgi:uroporphyrin-III C-methyltransferase/precorrin-2 dehydrogenase/sirohydrochlorin ferrochelatase